MFEGEIGSADDLYDTANRLLDILDTIAYIWIINISSDDWIPQISLKVSAVMRSRVHNLVALVAKYRAHDLEFAYKQRHEQVANAREAEDRRMLVDAELELCNICTDYAEMRNVAQSALESSSSMGDPQRQGWSRMYLGIALSRIDSTGTEWKHQFVESIGCFERCGEKKQAGKIAHTFANTALEIKNFNIALEAVHLGLRVTSQGTKELNDLFCRYEAMLIDGSMQRKFSEHLGD